MGGLLGDEGRLALGKDHHAGAEPDVLGGGRHEREQGERLVEGNVLVVGSSAPAPGPVRVRAEYVVVGQDVVGTQRFRPLGEVAYRAGIGADLVVREYHAEFHPLLRQHASGA